MTPFEEAIKKYLDQVASEDAAFREKYEAKDKSLTKCCDYIVSEVKRQKRQGFSDDEIYYMARHYYNEPNEALKIDKKQKDCRIVVNESIEGDMVDEVDEEEETKVVKKPKTKVAPKPKEPAQEQLSIFDLGVEL